MKKKFLSIIVAAAMVMSLLPMSALASEQTETGVVSKTGADGSATTYTSISAALANEQPASSISLTLTGDLEEDVTIPAGMTVTLDLAGHKITNVSSDTITVEIGATLTINDSSTTKTGTVDNTTHAKGAIFNNGTVVLNGGTYDRSKEAGSSATNNGGNSWYTICNHGIMTINNGVSVVTAGGGAEALATVGKYSSLIENGYQSYTGSDKRGEYAYNYSEGVNHANPTLKINGGTFSGGINTVKVDEGGIATIDGGTFTNYVQHALQNWNICTVNDGEFAAEDRAALYCGEWNDYSVGQLTVNGGTFSSKTGNVIQLDNSLPGTVEIYGGNFSTDVSDYVPTGYKCTANADETYTVSAIGNTELVVKPDTSTKGTASATLDGNFSSNATVTNPDNTEASGSVSGTNVSVNLTPNASGDDSTTTTASLTVTGSTAGSMATSSATLTITSSVGTLSVSNGALQTIVGNATDATGGTATIADVTLSIEKKDDTASGGSLVYTLTAMADNRDVFTPETASNNADITVTVKYDGETEPSVYYLGENGAEKVASDLVTLDTENDLLTWTVSHFSDWLIREGDNTISYQASTASTPSFTDDLSTALTAVAAGGVITIYGDVEETAIDATITGDVTINGNGTITATGTANESSPYEPAITVDAGGSLTLDGVTMNISGTVQDETADTHHGQGLRLYNDANGSNGAKLNLTNNASLTLSDLEAAMVFPTTASSSAGYATVTMTGGSTLNIRNVDGNASNGGTWNISENSTINISSCGSHGLSGEIINVDNSTVNVSGVGLVGMIATNITLENGAAVSITESGASMTGGTATWAPDGNSYKRDVELKQNGTLSITDGSTLTLADNVQATGFEGRETNAVYVSGGSSAAIVDSTFTGERFTNDDSGTVTIVNSTVNGTLTNSTTDSDAVALIGTTTYNKLSDAVTAIGTSTDPVIINLLQNTTENITIPVGANITIEGGQNTLYGDITCTVTTDSSKTTKLTLNELNMDGDTDAAQDGYEADYGISSSLQKQESVSKLELTMTDCTVKHYTNKGIYLTNAVSMTIDGCTFEDNATTDINTPNTKGDYTIDLNLMSVDAENITITNTTFTGDCGDKAVIKVAARGGASDAGVADVGTITEATVDKLTITGCTFNATSTDVDVNIGTDSKVDNGGAGNDGFAENTTGAYAVDISNNNTAVVVNPAYQTYKDGDNYYLTTGDGSTPVTNITVPVGGSLTKEANSDELILVTNQGGGSSGGSTRYAVTAPSNVSNGAVTVSPSRASYNQTVTITVTPDEGYELSSLTVTDRNGSTISLTKVSDTRYTFTMPRSAVTISASFAEEELVSSLPFTDVSVDDWFYDMVEYVYDNGIMTGTSGTTFEPNATLTRAMMATVLWAMEGNPTAGSGSYTDVSSGDWYYNAVRWATSAGVVNGVGDNTFAPNDPLTREQMAVMLYAYAVYKGYDTAASTAAESFNDSGEISGWALTAMNWAVDNGLLGGKPGNLLDPTGSATRAEIATILRNFCENIVK